VSPCLDAAFQALGRTCTQDLRELHIIALAFTIAVGGPRPIAVAWALDEDGNEHWLAARHVRREIESAYLSLLSDLLLRGLRAPRPLIADPDGYPRLATWLQASLGANVGSTRAFGP
jgi:hypothetical protein